MQISLARDCSSASVDIFWRGTNIVLLIRRKAKGRKATLEANMDQIIIAPLKKIMVQGAITVIRRKPSDIAQLYF